MIIKESKKHFTLSSICLSLWNAFFLSHYSYYHTIHIVVSLLFCFCFHTINACISRSIWSSRFSIVLHNNTHVFAYIYRKRAREREKWSLRVLFRMMINSTTNWPSHSARRIESYKKIISMFLLLVISFPNIDKSDISQKKKKKKYASCLKIETWYVQWVLEYGFFVLSFISMYVSSKRNTNRFIIRQEKREENKCL